MVFNEQNTECSHVYWVTLYASVCLTEQINNDDAPNQTLNMLCTTELGDLYLSTSKL